MKRLSLDEIKGIGRAYGLGNNLADCVIATALASNTLFSPYEKDEMIHAMFEDLLNNNPEVFQDIINRLNHSIKDLNSIKEKMHGIVDETSRNVPSNKR